MIALLFSLAAATATPADPRLERAVEQAIRDEIDHGILATKTKDMDLYMEAVPDDYRQVEDDGSITDKAALRAMQTQAWAIIPRTNRLEIAVTGFKLGCGGTCATVNTDQLWDRQMLGRDGKSEFNVVTTQRHIETWELRGSRWINVDLKELGGTLTIDGVLQT